MRSRDVDKIHELAESLDLECEDLDELVHNAKGEEAAAINNGGMKEQIRYLGENMTASAMDGIIRMAAQEKGDAAVADSS